MLIKTVTIFKCGTVNVTIAYSACNDKNDNYKQLYRIQPPSNKKYYDKQIKSYVLSLESQNSKMNLPASDQK